MLHYTRASDCSLLVTFNEKSSGQAVRLLRQLERHTLPGITSISPAFTSLLLRYNPLELRAEQLQEQVETLVQQPYEDEPPARLITLPVCYDAECAPDLADVADQHHRTPEEIAALHASVTYQVQFLGFVPGFAYLGDVDQTIATPRRTTPRTVVPAGSVAIADRQTAVYPLTTPGGWNLIGRCPVLLFSPAKPQPSLLLPGDRVRFVPITVEEFHQQLGQQE